LINLFNLIPSALNDAVKSLNYEYQEIVGLSRHLYLTSWHSDAQGWASECPDVKNYKWLLNQI